jgi:hypothetical protein
VPLLVGARCGTNGVSAGGGSEEIMSELAIKEEVKDLKNYWAKSSKL